MTAAKFIDIPALAIHRPKPTIFEKPKPVIDRRTTTAYHFITLLGREIADNLTIFTEAGILSRQNIRHIDRGFTEDMERTWQTAKKADQTDRYLEDFDLVVGFFGRLADRHLSDYQRQSNSRLQPVLATILMMEFSMRAARWLTKRAGKATNPKTMRKLDGKKAELEKWFLAERTKYSNQEFCFSVFEKTMEEMIGRDYLEMINYLER